MSLFWVHLLLIFIWLQSSKAFFPQIFGDTTPFHFSICYYFPHVCEANSCYFVGNFFSLHFPHQILPISLQLFPKKLYTLLFQTWYLRLLPFHSPSLSPSLSPFCNNLFFGVGVGWEKDALCPPHKMRPSHQKFTVKVYIRNKTSNFLNLGIFAE